MTTDGQIAGGVTDGGGEQGRRQAMELRDRIRMVAAQDPDLAQHLVDQLIVALDRATGGTFREHLDPATRGVADRALVQQKRPAENGHFIAS